jgi:hypothetical protein
MMGDGQSCFGRKGEVVLQKGTNPDIACEGVDGEPCGRTNTDVGLYQCDECGEAWLCRICKGQSQNGQIEYWAQCWECAKKFKDKELREEIEKRFPAVTQFVNAVGSVLQGRMEQDGKANENDASVEADGTSGVGKTVARVEAALDGSPEIVDERKVAVYTRGP